MPYLRPIGLVYGRDAHLACAAGEAGSLGGGSIAFSALELIEGRGDTANREIIGYQTALSSSDLGVKARLEALTAPRDRLPGLSGQGPFVMGIVNVTPDSFSDAGEHRDPDNAIEFARTLISQGVDILDIGGESTRPGATPVAQGVELARVVPVIDALSGGKTPISIDTRNAGVMEKAASLGAGIINDVTALGYDSEALEVAARLDLPVILMHALDKPETMQDDPHYGDVLLDVYDYLAGRIKTCEAAGISKGRLIVDPGIGFGKTVAHNLALLRGLGLFHGLGVHLALGTSRKGFIGALSGVEVPQERVPGSLASALAGAAQGVHILRVHDVAATVQALAIFKAVLYVE